MKDIIEEWKLEKDEDSIWREAADTWRLPYWDWARRQVYAETFALPEVLTMATVKIFPPKSKAELYEEKYPNPLYGFDNPEKDKETGDPLPFGKMPKGKEKYNINDNQKDKNPIPNKPASDRVLPVSNPLPLRQQLLISFSGP
jgi:tyrosinase